MSDEHPLDGLLEEGAKEIPAGYPHAITSIAISLKRIADALDGTTVGVGVNESLAGLTAHMNGRNG